MPEAEDWHKYCAVRRAPGREVPISPLSYRRARIWLQLPLQDFPSPIALSIVFSSCLLGMASALAVVLQTH